MSDWPVFSCIDPQLVSVALLYRPASIDRLFLVWHDSQLVSADLFLIDPQLLLTDFVLYTPPPNTYTPRMY